jgi:prefoldin subunit 5
MASIVRALSMTFVLATSGLVVAGCAGDGSGNIFSTGSLGTSGTSAAAESKIDPACTTLSAQIDTLKGVADKVAQAAVKKYKMTTADLAKADQLNKANADFQAKCSSLTPKSAMAVSAPGRSTSTQ